MRGTLASLTTRGRCLLAAGVAAALCSTVLNERDLLRVAAFVAALPLLSGLLVAGRRLGLSARRRVAPPRVPAGEATTVTLEVRATGRVPGGGLLLEDGVPYHLGHRPRFVVEALPRRAGVQLTYPLRPRLRGIHQIGPLRGRITDPFGLAEFEHELTGQSRFVVVPAVVPLSGLPGGSGKGAGDDGSIRLRSGQGEDDAVVRQYRQGDDLRRVHWRSTARRDELMVRVEERPWRGGTTVLLDRRVAAHRGEGQRSSLEWAVSFCASVCLHLHHHGHQVRLITEDGQLFAGDATESRHDDLLLDALAGLSATRRTDFNCRADPGGGHELIAILGALSPAASAELIASRTQRARSLAVLLDVPSWAGRAGGYSVSTEHNATLFRSAGWSVVVASAGTPMAQVWDQLCRRDITSSPLGMGGPR